MQGEIPRMRKTLPTDMEEHRYRENSGFKFCHTRRRINFGKALCCCCCCCLFCLFVCLFFAEPPFLYLENG